MPFFTFLGDQATVRDVMLDRPRRFLPVCGTFTQELLRGPSPLSVAERELIAAYVSALNACQYCAGVHTAITTDNGLDGAVVQALVDDADTAAVDDRLKPILRYVKKLTQTPSRMVQADYDAVMAAGWDEQALGDAIAVCALFNFYNRLVEGHGIKGNPAGYAVSVERLRALGYETFLREAADREAADREAAERAPPPAGSG